MVARRAAPTCPTRRPVAAARQRKSSGATSSESFPTRPLGCWMRIERMNGGAANYGSVISLGNHPGARAFVRTPRSPQLTASARVRLITAAFVAV